MVNLFILVLFSSVATGVVYFFSIILSRLFHGRLNLKVKTYTLNTIIILQPMFILLTVIIVLFGVNFQNEQEYFDNIGISEFNYNSLTEMSNMEKLEDVNITKTDTLIDTSTIIMLTNNLAYIWFSVFMISFILKMMIYIKFKSNLKKSGLLPIHCGYEKLKIYKSKAIHSPYITGIFKPSVILPNVDMDEFELSLVIKHESTHFKNRDLQFKMILELLKCVNWFNPIFYIIQKQFNQVSELVTDSVVTADLSTFQCKKYGMLILRFAESAKSSGNNIISPRFYSYLSEDAKNLKDRLELIMKKERDKKVNKFTKSIIITVMVLVVSAGVYNLSTSYASIMKMHKEAQANILDETNTEKSNGNLIYDDGKVQIFDGDVDDSVSAGLAMVDNNQNLAKKQKDVADVKIPASYDRILKTIYKKGEYRSDAKLGDSICSLSSGTVVFSGFKRGYGNCITIEDKKGRIWQYAFCSKLLANSGDSVAVGDLIAYAGHSGLTDRDSIFIKLIKK